MRTIYRAFATALVLIQTACFNDTTADRTVVYQPVTAYQVVEQPGFEILRSFTGVVQPAQSAEVGFELGGTIKLFPVDEGDRVAAGDQLASLDKSLLKVERRQLEAQDRRHPEAPGCRPSPARQHQHRQRQCRRCC